MDQSHPLAADQGRGQPEGVLLGVEQDEGAARFQLRTHLREPQGSRQVEDRVEVPGQVTGADLSTGVGISSELNALTHGISGPECTHPGPSRNGQLHQRHPHSPTGADDQDAMAPADPGSIQRPQGSLAGHRKCGCTLEAELIGNRSQVLSPTQTNSANAFSPRVR